MRWLIDLIGLIRDVRTTLPRPVRIWGALLNVPQIIGGVAFIIFPEGAAILLLWLVAMSICGQVHRHHRFSRLIGVGHAVWLPLLPFLFIRAVEGASSGAGVYEQIFVVWLWYVAITMTISILFDAWDFWKYVTSDNRSMVND